MREDKRTFLDRWYIERPFLDGRYVETWLREHGHMYKYELAYKGGIAGSTLSKLIAGHVKPHPSTVERLAEAMGVDPAELVVSPDDVPPEIKRKYKRRQAKIRKYVRKKRWEESNGDAKQGRAYKAKRSFT